MTDLPPPGSPADGQPGIRILAQYIRDLSFESPRAPESLRAGGPQPQVDLGVELNARGRPDGFYEVELKLNAKAARDNEPVFVVELIYAGLYQVDIRIPQNAPTGHVPVSVGIGAFSTPAGGFITIGQ